MDQDKLTGVSLIINVILVLILLAVICSTTSDTKVLKGKYIILFDKIYKCREIKNND